MKITLFGAGGMTGHHIVRLAKARGVELVASEYSAPYETADGPKIERVTADVTSDDLTAEIDGSDAVISAIGLPLTTQTVLDPPPVYIDGTTNIVSAMEKTGVKRLIVISASFVANRHLLPLWFRGSVVQAMDKVFEQMAEMENMLVAHSSTIDWTAVRPGWLLDEPQTGDYIVQPDAIAPDTLRTRHADLADFMLRCCLKNEWVHKTPAISGKEDAVLESPAALARELAQT